METCEDCGFAWETVPSEQVGPRTLAGTRATAELLRREPSHGLLRPSPDRWSMVEYGAHVRDVLLTVRDRCVIGLVENDPGFKPMYRDERVDLGLYSADTAEAVADELAATASMFVRLFEAIDPAMLDRPVRYGFPDPMARTVRWMGQQAVHEVEHHLGDVNENFRTLTARPA